MPELPEVETIRRDLDTHIRGKTIAAVSVRLPRLVRGSVRSFSSTLRGKSITRLDRIGKLLIIVLDSEQYVLVHLKMTGQLIFQKKDRLIAGGHSYGSDTNTYPNTYTYITLTFSDNSELYFNDMRTFGYMALVDTATLQETKQQYGIEPLQSDFTYENFVAALGNRKTTIKAALLNQKLFAGIGNIYADEICFAARVRPDRIVASVSTKEKRALFQATEKIIAKAIKLRGTTFNNYVDSFGKQGNYLKQLQVFDRKNKTCKRCKAGVINKIKVAGRGTHFCSVCQK